MFTLDPFTLPPTPALHDTAFLEHATLDWFAVDLAAAAVPQAPAPPPPFFEAACCKPALEQAALDALLAEHFSFTDGFINDDDHPLAAAVMAADVVPVGGGTVSAHLAAAVDADVLDLLDFFPGALPGADASSPFSAASSFSAESSLPSVASTPLATPSSTRPPSPAAGAAATKKRKRAPDTRKRVRPTVQQKAARAQALLAQLEADNTRLRRELAAAQASMTAVVPLVRQLLHLFPPRR